MKRISALGDSILKGIVLDRPTDTDPGPRYTVLAERFSERCRRALDLVIDNYGRFGNTVTRGLRDLERHREGIAASDFVVLEYGGNDCDFHWEEIGAAPAGQHAPRTPLDRFAATYRDLIGRIRQAGAVPVLLSLPPLVPDRFFAHVTRGMTPGGRRNVLDWIGGTVERIGDWHELYNLAVFQLAGACRVPLIDITTPFLLDRRYADRICDDGIHPNEEGHRLIAETICRYAADRFPASECTRKTEPVR